MADVVQSEFTDLADADEFRDEPVIIHRRTAERENSSLILFVHGLGGSRYGKKSTWGDFPRLVYENFPQADVGIYSYVTALGRLRFWQSIDLESEARVLADIIRDGPHDHVIMLGHSMGGLLAKTAIHDLISRNDDAALKRIAGLFLLATPQAGSLRVPGFLAWTTNDLRVLKPHGELVTRVTATFKNRVAYEREGARADAFVIPTWVVYGASDFWVSQLSAGFDLPDRRTKSVRRSHTGVVKPRRGKTDDVFEWVARHIKSCLALTALPQSSASESASAQSSSERSKVFEEIIDPKGWSSEGRFETFPRAADIAVPFGPPVGIFPSRIAAGYAPKNGHPPYIRREIDPVIDNALRGEKSVLVFGAPRAGKTRTAWEALLRNLKESRVIFPNRSHPAPLGALAAIAPPVTPEDGPVILWLDDAYRFLCTGDLSYATLAKLRKTYARVVVIATLATNEIDGLRRPKGAAADDPGALAALDVFSRVLSEFVELRLNDHLWSDGEAEARKLYPELVDQPGFVQGLGRFFAASEERWSRYVEAFDTSKTGAAIVTAAIDWSRAGMLRPVTALELRQLAPLYIARLAPGPVPPDKLDAALTWACDASLLVKSSDRNTEETDFRAPTDMVLRASEQGTPWGGGIPEQTWDFVIDSLRPYDGVGVARAAIEAGNWRVALRAAEHTANSEANVSGAAALLAAVASLMNDGPSELVDRYLERAAADSDGNLAGGASIMLAALRLEAGKLDDAERLLQPFLEGADKQQQTAARILAGMVSLNRGQYDRANAYAQRILETELSDDNAVLAALLLMQLAERTSVSDLSKIDALIASIIASPQNKSYYVAHFVAGLVALKRGQIDSARNYLQAVKESGPPFLRGRATVILGILAVTLGGFDEGESLLSPLLTSNDVPVFAYASLGMGMLLEVKGDHNAARARFQETIDKGQFALRKQATLQVGVLEAACGNAEISRRLLDPYKDDEDAAASVAQGAALTGNIEDASRRLKAEQIVKLPVIEQLLMVQRGLQAADDPNRLEAAQWLLDPYRASGNPILASLSLIGGGIIAIARRQFERAERLLEEAALKAPAKLALMAKMNLGAAALQKGDPDEAERRLGPLADQPSVGARSTFLLATAALSQERKEPARSLFQRAADLAIDDLELKANAQLMLGSIALQSGDLAEAARFFEMSLNVESPAIKSAAHLGLSHVAERGGDLDSARKHAEAAVALKPDNGLGLVRFALLASMQNDSRVALEAEARLGGLARQYVHQLMAQFPPGAEQAANAPEEFSQFLELARRDLEHAIRVVQSEAAVAQARLLMMDGQKEAAMAEIGRSVMLDSKNHQALLMRGHWHRQAGRLHDAMKDFNLALQIDPESSLALANRGLTYRMLGDSEKALIDLDGALERDKKLNWALLERAGLWLERGKRAEAAADIERLAQLDEKAFDSVLHQAFNEVRDGRANKALELFSLALILAPNHPNALAGRGSLLSTLGRDDEALNDFAQALQAAPNDIAALLTRAEHYSNRWDLAAALADIERALALDPQNAGAHANYGAVLGLLGRHDEAIERFNIALKLDPRQAWVLVARGAEYRRAVQYAESAADIDRAIDLGSDDNGTLSERAETAIATRDYDEAIGLLTRAIDRNAGDLDWVHYVRGRARYAQGLAADALQDFDEAICLSERGNAPVNPMQAFNHAVYRLAGGQSQEAIERYRVLTRKAPPALLREVLLDLAALKKSGPWDPVTGDDVIQLLESRIAATQSNG